MINGAQYDVVIEHKSDDSPSAQPFEAFRYLIFERSQLYRSIIDVFAQAKTEFRLHLRPGEVHSRLHDYGLSAADDEVVAALDQLVIWGNLQSYHDSAEMATLADFQRRKLLYQLSAKGEAAQRAAVEFLQWLSRPIALEAEALVRIRDLLAELAKLTHAEERDAGKLATLLRQISADTEQLTAQAQSFFRWLHEQTAQRGDSLAEFLRYKEQLIDYLQRFLAELAAQSDRIAANIVDLEPKAEHFLQCVAEQEAAAAFARDGLERRQLTADAHTRWLQRWRGLRRWFVGIEGEPQVKQLRMAASAAIPRLLAIAAQFHDRRASRSDRKADMLELAIWFLEADNDRLAHRLWTSAFAAGSVRHLRINSETLDQRDQNPISPSQSWLDAPPVFITPQLRATGRGPAAAPARRVVDRGAERRELRRRRDDEQHRLEAARSTLIELGKRRLAEIGRLSPEALSILVELLDRVAGRRSLGNQATAESEDGSLSIGVDWNVPHRIATIETPLGRLHTPDLQFHVFASGSDSVEVPAAKFRDV